MNYYLLGGIVIAFILINFARKVFTENLKNKLTNAIYQGRIDEFDKIVSKKYVKYLIHPFNLDFLKLNKAIISENRKEIDLIFDRFEKAQLTDNQKIAVYEKGFYYYLQEKNNNKFNKYYQLIKELPDQTLLNRIQDAYSICGLKDTKLLEKYETLLQKEPNNMNVLFLLYNVYKNLGNENKANEILEKYAEAQNNNINTQQ